MILHLRFALPVYTAGRAKCVMVIGTPVLRRRWSIVPQFAKSVKVVGPSIEIDGQPFPWFTRGGVQVQSGGKQSPIQEVTLTIVVDGPVVIGGESQLSPVAIDPAPRVAPAEVEE